MVKDEEYAVQADLYIDCTGFKSLLIGDYQGVEFQPFQKKLANDSALAARLPYIDREREMHNVTDCTALGNGWVWNIPLWNRIGTGYCYSSRFVTDEEAEKEFRQHLAEKHSPEISENATLSKINIRHGKRKLAWCRNVVAIGLSYGFVEPLESTGLLTTHENVIKLVDILNRREGYVTRAEIDGFNYVVDGEVAGFCDFISMHYAFSMREDTPYWRWATQINEYHPLMMSEFINKQLGYQKFLDSLSSDFKWNPSLSGTNFIAAGMGLTPMSTPAMIEANNYDRQQVLVAKEKYEEYRDFITEHVMSLPSHYEYLRDNIYGGIDKHVQEKELG